MQKLLIIALVLLVSLMVTAPALANDGDPQHHLCEDINGDGKINGRDFAQHIVQHAQAGILGAEHNPGMHQGFSICVATAP